MDKTAREIGEKLQAITLAKSVVYIDTAYTYFAYRSNVEADLTIEKQWRTSLQVFTYLKLIFMEYKGHSYICTYIYSFILCTSTYNP